MSLDKLRELTKHSIKMGLNPDLVQASGGNTSWKSNKTVWVKGSGKRLKDAASEDIFSSINYAALTQDDVLICEDFSSLVLNNISPSIETNLHIFLEANFVTHLHSLGSIAIGVATRNYEYRNLNHEVRFVPYARPGVELVNAINTTERFTDNSLILQNHGVIVSGQESFEIENKIEKLERDIHEYFTRIPEKDSFPNWIEILTSGVLTPDEAVFLGAKPFVKSEEPIPNSVGINLNGELLFPKGFSDDRTDLAKFYMRVAKLIERKTQVGYLPEKEVSEILVWDKEQVRIAMAK
jgi:rhamnose utilization protein RhaD (predicted bifunctional aldolase and dehydrogenase)